MKGKIDLTNSSIIHYNLSVKGFTFALYNDLTIVHPASLLEKGEL